MNSRIKKLVAFLALCCTGVFAADLAYLENTICPQARLDLQRGRYQNRKPLINKKGSEFVILQKIGPAKNSYFAIDDGNRHIQLYKDMRQVYDFVIYRDMFWVLADGELNVFNAGGEFVKSFSYGGSSRYSAARGMFVYEDKLYLAYGDLGLVSFDFSTLSFNFINAVNTWQETGLRSMTTSLAIADDKVFVSLTGLQQGAFNGVVTFDLSTQEIVNRSAYRNGREGVIDIEARIYLQNDKVILNNGGWIHRLEKSDLYRRSIARPRWLGIPYSTPDGRRVYAMIKGDFVFDGGRVLGCAFIDKSSVLAEIKI